MFVSYSMMTAQKTKKDWILEAVERMNIGMLDILLCDSRSYSDAPKDVFLERLAVVFEKFRRKGNTYLTRHAGSCNGKNCSNKGCTGYAFVGNHSGACMELVVKESNDDILDLFSCMFFKRFGDEPEFIEIFTIEITDDEKVDFVPDSAYLLKNSHCRQAIDEVMCHKEEGQPPSFFANWLRKHHDLFISFRLPPYEYRNYKTFHELYSGLRDLNSFSLYKSTVMKAFDEFDAIDPQDDYPMMRWLLRYNKLWYNIDLYLHYHYYVEGTGVDAMLLIHDVKLSAKEYLLMSGFHEIYEHHNWHLQDRNALFRRRMTKIMNSM